MAPPAADKNGKGPLPCGPRAIALISKEETASRRQIQPRHYIPGSLDTGQTGKDSTFLAEEE
jgi:hypothetical protein